MRKAENGNGEGGCGDVAPFQGAGVWGELGSQGFSLGYDVTPFQGGGVSPWAMM